MGKGTTLTTLAITGGNGFIGRATQKAAKAIGRYDDIVILDRPDSIMGSFHKINGAQHVIHLAGMLGTSELFDSPEEAINVNIRGTVRVLEWCRRNNAGFTGITMPPAFPSVYAATKVAADRFASAWHHGYGLRVSKVRAFNAYGAEQKHGPNHPQKILPTFATEAWAGRPIPIWGDGNQLIDMVHVDDVATMLVVATAFGHDETFDAGTGYGITVNALAAAVLDITGSMAGVKHLPMRKGEVPSKICAEGEGWSLAQWKPEFHWSKIHRAVMAYKPA